MDFDAKICWLDSRKRPQLVEEILRGHWAFTSDRGIKQTTVQLLYKWLFGIFFGKWFMVIRVLSKSATRNGEWAHKGNFFLL